VTRRRVVVLALLGAAALLLIGRILSGLFIDYQWYAQMHASSVWESRLVNRLLLTGSIAVGTTCFVFANLYAVRRSIVSIVLPRRLANVEIGEELPARYLTGITVAVAVVLGMLLALPPEPWIELAAARYGLPFGDADPYFQMDLGFYVYWLPLENALYVRTLLVLVGTIFVVAVLYVAVTPSLRWDRTRFRLTTHVRRHLAALTPLFFAVVAWNYRLEAYAVLSHGAGPAGMFTYADHHYVIPAERILAIVLLAAGVVTGFALWRDQIKTALIGVTASLLVLAGYHFSVRLIDGGSVGPASAAREQGYVIVRRQATRAAYGVRRLAVVPPSAAPIRFPSLVDAASHVSIWDPKALTEAQPPTRQLSAVADGVGWRWSPSGLLAWTVEYGGEPTAEAGLQPPPVHLLRAVRATAVDEHGGPERSDFAGRPGADDVPVPPILIYPGASVPLIVADSGNRISAPALDGVGARLAASWSAQRLNWLGVQLPEPHPKLVDERDVSERVRAIAPFFTQGTLVWPIFAADSLYWAVDLYATAEMYPLSEHYTLAGEQRSYFQHAATAFVHAYTGRVFLVADSVRDSLAETWVRQFPELFSSRAGLPSGLVDAAPPPTDAALAMADAFAAVGARRSEREDAAPAQQPALIDNADSLMASGEPPCVALRTEPATCATAIPLMDMTDRLTGLVIAVGGAQHGTLWVPLDSGGTRWSSALARLRQAGDSALAGRRDASMARGRVRSFLVGNRLALVQPQYAWRSDAPKTLLVVTALVGDTVVTGPSLADAAGADTLAAAPLGGPAGPNAGGQGAAFRARVTALYDLMQGALKRGDLAAFGSAFNDLGRLVGERSAPRLPERKK
jgi:uncharacterized protein